MADKRKMKAVKMWAVLHRDTGAMQSAPWQTKIAAHISRKDEREPRRWRIARVEIREIK